jgi:hypothetical protein
VVAALRGMEGRASEPLGLFVGKQEYKVQYMCCPRRNLAEPNQNMLYLVCCSADAAGDRAVSAFYRTLRDRYGALQPGGLLLWRPIPTIILPTSAFPTWRQEAGYVLWAQRLLGVPVVPDSEGGGPHFDQEAICSAILEKLKSKAISYPTCQNFHLSQPGWIFRHHYSERFGVGGALVGCGGLPDASQSKQTQI